MIFFPYTNVVSLLTYSVRFWNYSYIFIIVWSQQCQYIELGPANCNYCIGLGHLGLFSSPTSNRIDIAKKDFISHKSWFYWLAPFCKSCIPKMKADYVCFAVAVQDTFSVYGKSLSLATNVTIYNSNVSLIWHQNAIQCSIPIPFSTILLCILNDN